MLFWYADRVTHPLDACTTELDSGQMVPILFPPRQRRQSVLSAKLSQMFDASFCSVNTKVQIL